MVRSLIGWLIRTSEWKLIGRVNACPGCDSVPVDLLRTLPSPLDAGGDCRRRDRRELLNRFHDIFHRSTSDTGLDGIASRELLSYSVALCFVFYMTPAFCCVGQLGSYDLAYSKTVRFEAKRKWGILWCRLNTLIIIIIIIITTTMFMVLSSWQSHCESSPGSLLFVCKKCTQTLENQSSEGSSIQRCVQGCTLGLAHILTNLS